MSSSSPVSGPPPTARPGGGAPPGGPAHAPRAGAHRPRRPRWHEFLPIIGVLLVVVVLAVGFLELKGSVLGGTSTGSSSNGPADDENGPAATGTSTKTGTGTSTTTPSGGSTGTGSATSGGSTSSTGSGSVSHSIPISVYNGTSRTGLAKGATGKLTAAGWTKASIGGNKTGYTGSTTVFYASPSQQASAKAVAKDLGGYAAQQSSQYGSGVTVVLGSDYTS